MNRLVSVIVASVLVASLPSLAVAGEAHGFQKDDILKIARSQRDSIETYFFRFTLSSRKLIDEKFPLDDISAGTGFFEQEEARSGSKQRYSSRKDENAKADLTNTWDGQVLKAYYRTPKQGQVSSNTDNYMLSAGNTPLTSAMYADSTKDVFGVNHNRDIVAYLSSRSTSLMPATESLEGVDCVVATFGPPGQARSKVWLDPKRGFAVLQIINYNPNDVSKPWWIVRNSQWKDCGNGVWLPAKTVLTTCLAMGSPKERWGVPAREDVYTASVMQVNEDLPDELFSVKFPPGTRVTDMVLNTSYVEGKEEEKIKDVVNEIFDEPIEPDVESNVIAPPVSASEEADATITEPHEVAGTDDNRENGSSPLVLRIIVLALAIILVGAAVSVVLLRRRSRIR